MARDSDGFLSTWINLETAFDTEIIEAAGFPDDKI